MDTTNRPAKSLKSQFGCSILCPRTGRKLRDASAAEVAHFDAVNVLGRAVRFGDVTIDANGNPEPMSATQIAAMWAL